MVLIADRLEDIRVRMQGAAMTAGRKPEGIQLIAVSKTYDERAVRDALDAGQYVFGENRVQEARTKFINLRAAHPKLELHLIGPLQTNKTDDAVALFDVIQTLDRPKLAMALAKSIAKLHKKPRLYVEVNIGEEPQKAGIIPDALGDFLVYCRDEAGLVIEGLMCIPPNGIDPTLFFQRMKQMADHYHMPHLSMGMSADFAAAIACGATEVRIGSAIFGERVKPV